MAIKALSGWTTSQKHVVAASYLGWTLDALDFFLLVFVLKDIAAEFHVDITLVSLAVTLTLAVRPLGAFLFGRLADHYGRRPILILNIAIYSLLSFATSFVPQSADVPSGPHRLRHRHGGRLGDRLLAGDGDDPTGIARRRLGTAAVRLFDRLSARLARFRAALRPHRLARDVCGRAAAGDDAHPLCLREGAGIPGVRPVAQG